MNLLGPPSTLSMEDMTVISKGVHSLSNDAFPSLPSDPFREDEASDQKSTKRSQRIKAEAWGKLNSRSLKPFVFLGIVLYTLKECSNVQVNLKSRLIEVSCALFGEGKGMDGNRPRCGLDVLRLNVCGKCNQEDMVIGALLVNL
ncbi:hypothetical protein Tco_0949960 [Tanacetum coccineum]